MDDDPTRPPVPRRRRHRRLLLVAVSALLIALAVGLGYIGIGYYAYTTKTLVTAHCDTRPFASTTPADFVTWRGDQRQPLDTTPYHFTDYSNVAFPARGESLAIRGWYAPGNAGPATPTVILVHGRDSCRRDSNVMLPAGMLHRAGFGVLLIDLRNHGESDVDNGRWAGGAKEYADVLGAWDWLVAQGHDPTRIGLFGASMGAGTVTIATGEEPDVAATWADSSPADLDVMAAEYAEENGLPSWVAAPAVSVGRVIGDPELGTRSPDAEAAKLHGRPFFIVHGLSDETVLPHHAVDLAAAAYRGGTKVEPWLVPGSRHTEEILDQTDRYEARLVAFFRAALGSPT